jgi:cytochrome c peroxidase
MRKSLLVFLWVATLAVVGVPLWRVTQPRVNAPAPVHAEPPIAAAKPTATPASASLFSASPFQPLPLDVEFDKRKVTLGDRLFHEKRLSSDGTIACSSCHDLEKGGADSRRFSVGVGGKVGQLNAPTVFNGGFNFRQFWDGRADTLEKQVDGPLLHPAEMGSTWADVLSTLKSDSAYAKAFAGIYPDGVTPDNARDAVATFERSLITPNSRFDRYLRGETGVLTDIELKGFRLFTEIGCVTCHQGMNIGGNMFQALGRVGNYFADRGDETARDLGRFNVTGDERDRHKFKVPSLRNVELTAPYLHDGSAATLEEVVQIMARYQIGQPIHDDEVASLVAFLRTLTGESPRRL